MSHHQWYDPLRIKRVSAALSPAAGAYPNPAAVFATLPIRLVITLDV